MSRPWRNLAILLFIAALLFGGLVGDQLLAVNRDTQNTLRLYTELLNAAHQSYGVDITYRDLVYASIQGMLRSLDPHTSFLPPESYEDMRQRQQSSFYGLGILVSMRNGQLTVISPIEGTPAWRLGLRAGDIISTIEGEPTDTMLLDEAVSKLKGPKGTQVTINVVRRGLEEPLELAITRAEIPQNTVRYAYMLTPDVGYIRLTDFSRSTSNEMSDAVDKLKADGMKNLILDLRSNGGGLLDQAIEVSDLFVPEKTRIVETRGRVPESYQTFSSDGDRPALHMPLVVLVNSGTASAAEILSGAIQDHDVGLVAGTATWGKGLVQTVYNLSYGSGVALTTAKYYTPAGRLIQRDYSSYFEYYTHFNNDGEEDTSEVSVDNPEFQTDLGRKVYGGGGITPDVEVDLPETPAPLPFLFTRNAFFEFAVDYYSQHADIGLDWEPDQAVLEQFHQWLVDEKILEPGPLLDKLFTDSEVSGIAKRQIHSDIFTSAFGTEASHKVLAEGDPQIQEALKLFDRAAELLAKREQLQVVSPRQLAAATDSTVEGGQQTLPQDRP